MEHKNALRKDGSCCALRVRTGRAWRTDALRIAGSLARAGSTLLLLFSVNAFAATEETFAVLKVGNQTYQNVRVTTKGKNFIIIAHSRGITSLKLSQLPRPILRKLGYPVPPDPKKHNQGPALWAFTPPGSSL
jgi:hypothetical protein